MTVAATAAKAGPYTGNDSASAFAFEFKVFADTDIRVVETLISTGVETDLVLNTNYTVSRNADQDTDPGGEITYKVGGVTTALPSTKKLTIVGDFDFTQPTDIPNGGAFFASVIEAAIDRATLLIKQVKERVDRAVVVDVSSTANPDDLLDAIDAAVLSTAADAVSTAADVVSTAADVVACDAAVVLAEAAAANLPNAPTAGASKFVQTNATADGWLYHAAAAARTALGSTTIGDAVFVAASTDVAKAAIGVETVGTPIASAATLDLTGVDGDIVHITGTVATSAVTMNTGQKVRCIADAAWPLTYNATTNRTNTNGDNYTLTAGDVVVYTYDGVTVIGEIIPKSGFAVKGSTAATQAEQETATATDVYVSPGRQQYHPSAAKAWVKFNGVGTVAIVEDYNVTSITDNGTGDYTINFTVAFSNTLFTGLVNGSYVAGDKCGIAHEIGITTTSYRFEMRHVDNVKYDMDTIRCVFMGDQ